MVISIIGQYLIKYMFTVFYILQINISFNFFISNYFENIFSVYINQYFIAQQPLFIMFTIH
jgi:hypothetical protein